jgi:predicted kinase
MPTIYIMIGIAGVGKSTYARKLSSKTGAVIISSDEVCKAMYHNEKVMGNDKYIFKRMRKMAIEEINKGNDVIIDATNLTPRRRGTYCRGIEFKNCRKVAILMKRPLKICKSQNAKRDESQRVPNNMIYLMSRALIEPTLDEGFDAIWKK